MQKKDAGIVFAVVAAVGVGIVFSLLPAAPQPRQFSQANLDVMAGLIRSRGFSCATAINMRDMFTGGGFVVKCDADAPGVQYWFNVADNGGKWSVTSKGLGD